MVVSIWNLKWKKVIYCSLWKIERRFWYYLNIKNEKGQIVICPSE